MNYAGSFEIRGVHVRGLVLPVIPDAVIGTDVDYIAGATYIVRYLMGLCRAPTGIRKQTPPGLSEIACFSQSLYRRE